MSQLEQQIVQALTGLLALAVSGSIAYVTPRAKRWIAAHTTAQTAQTARTVITGLGEIAEAVVEDFNQRVVSDAKTQGTWTPALAVSVKADAVRAVMSQGAHLAALGETIVGNVPSLVSTLIEQAVRWRKTVATVPQVPSAAATTTTQPVVSIPVAPLSTG